MYLNDWREYRVVKQGLAAVCSAGSILRWLLPLTLLALVAGATWGLLFTPPDFRQGNSYRIIYIHVPAAVVALAGYYVMAIAGAISLIWKMKMADVAMKSAAPIGAALTFIALVTGAIALVRPDE